MKGFRKLLFIGFVGLSALLLLPQLTRAQQYKPGANFWGDYDNSSIDGPDVGALATALAGMDPGYWVLLPTARNRTPKWQELDGNGNVDGPDLGILKAWAKGDFSDITGNPASLAAENYNPSVDAGDSVAIRARGPSWNAGKWRPGYGIVYEIRDDLSTCHGATIYGRKVLDGKVYGYYADMAYEYTAEPGDGGWASDDINPGRSIRVLAPGNCANNSEIVVEVYIPGDSEFGVYSKRHPARQTATPNIVINVICTISSVEVSPNIGTEGTSDNLYTLTAYCAEGGQHDVTGDSEVSGNCSGGAGTVDFPELCGNDDPPDCTVTDPGSGQSDVIDVQDDGDTITGIVCTITSDTEGPIGTPATDCAALGCLYSWSDGGGNCNDVGNNADTDAVVTGSACSKGVGNYGCRAELCGNDNTTCTITASTKTDTFTGADDTDTIVALNCSIGSVGEGASAALGCSYDWSENGTCNDTTDNGDTDASVSGANCSKSGSNGACAEVCGNDNWTCNINSAKDTGANPDDTYACNDDGDTITGLVCSITSDTEGPIGTPATDCAALGCLYSWSDGGGNCNDVGNNADTDAVVTGSACSKGAGNYGCRAELCGNDNTTCTITASTFTDTFTGADDTDTIVALNCSIVSAAEGGSSALGCQYDWSENGTCNDTTDNGDTDVSVSGANCSKDGVNGTCAEVCGNDNWTCNLTSAKDTGANPDDTYTCNDDGDTITGLVCSITSDTEGPIGTPATDCAALGCLYSWSDGGGNCNDVGNNADTDAAVTGTACSKGAGNYGCRAELCGNDDTTCTITASTFTDTFNGLDDTDTISGIVCSITSDTEGPIATPATDCTALGCLYSWSEGGNCDDLTDIANTDATVGGAANCSKGAGNYGCAAELCGNDSGNCVIGSAKTSGTDSFTATDDADTLTGIVCSITSDTEGPIATPATDCTALGCLYSWSEGGNCDDLTDIADTDAAVTGSACSKGAGNYGCRAELCGNDNTTCTITASTFTDTFTGADDNDTIVALNCSIVSATEGGSAALGCQYDWSENGTCNDTTDNGDTDVVVSGANCSKDGVNGTCAEVCGNDNWTCNITSVKDTGADPDDTYACNDDVDTITGLVCSITSDTEGPIGTPATDCTALGCLYSWSDGGGNCNDVGNNADTDAVISGAVNCSKGAGNYGCAAELCGNDSGTCTITASGVTDTFIATDDNDTLVALNCSIVSATEGGSSALGCQYDWSENGTCNDTTDNGDTDASVSGANCSKSASNGACAEVCGNDNWTCNINSAKDTGADPDDTYACNDDGDTITGLVCSITSDTEGPIGTPATDCTALGCLYSWSDGGGNCNDVGNNADTDAAVTGSACSKGAGNYGCRAELCGNDNTTCTITASTKTDTFTGVDDTDIITALNCSIGSVGEGASAALGCSYDWSEDGTCNDTTDNGDTDVVVSGANCSKAAPNAACAETCGNDNWTCNLTSAKDTGADPDDTYSCTDDGDTITGVVCSIVSDTEGPIGTPATDCTALGCLYSWSDGGGNCNDVGNNADTDAAVTGTACSKGAGNYGCRAELCGNDNTTCTITASTYTDTFTGADDTDTIAALNCSIVSAGEGTSSTPLGCSYDWSENGTCNDTTDNGDTDASVSGANCSKDGVNGACAEVNCDKENWTCNLTSAKDTGADPDDTYSCTNDDSITAVILKPDGPITMGPTETIQFGGTVGWGPDVCSEALCNNPDYDPAKAATLGWTDPVGCGSINTTTCIYTPPGAACNELISWTSYNSMQDSTTIYVETSPPKTTIDSNPPLLTGSTTATFEFSCDKPPCTFQCNLDLAGWIACVTPKVYTNLPEGYRDFKVRAIRHGNPDPSPAFYNWTIDLTPPDTSITAKPDNPTFETNPTFEFTCDDLPCTYECNLDSGGWQDCPSPSTYSWTDLSMDGAPSARAYHTAVWTGSEMIIWGGQDSEGYALNTGGRYDLITDSWAATDTTNAPTARYWHTAVWAETEMIVWGGFDGSEDTYAGGRYNPATDSWTETTTTDQIDPQFDPPSARDSHSAVWTGAEMIVWGGVDYGDSLNLNDGSRYDPIYDSWTATSMIDAPLVRQLHTAIWTGTEMIVWGGYGDLGALDSGAKYNPTSDSWTETSPTDAPAARVYHTAVWTDTEMIVWGGYDADVTYFNDGARYDPLYNHWTAISSSGAPDARYLHTAVWNGSEMMVWGGYYSEWVDEYYYEYYYDTGGEYDPAADSWTALDPANAPSARTYHTAVWADTHMIIWGGYYYDGVDEYYYDTGAIYGLTLGTHYFQVRATDQVGNLDLSPADWSWEIIGFSSLAAGGEHSCALGTDNSLWCWGYNFIGQLGIGNTVVQKTTPTRSGSPADAWWYLGLGSYHSCGIKLSSALLYCWGYNGNGQLGDGTTISKNSPAQIGASQWVEVAGGDNHSCGIKNAGTLFCWGDNDYGQLGDGTTVDRLTPRQVGTDNNWMLIATGASHSCAVKTDNSLYCWGDNTSGQLGIGSVGGQQTSPLRVGLSVWAEVAAGKDHTCAIQDGSDQLYCWGSNSYGQLGIGSSGGNYGSPQQESTASTDWMTLEVGDYFSCATELNGDVHCWGLNSTGQLGDGSLFNRNDPVRSGNHLGYTQLALGSKHACARKSNGAIDCWGHNAWGNLGQGYSSYKNVPTRVGDLSDWNYNSFSTIGENQACSIRSVSSDETLWCAGSNNYGQLGDGATVNKQHLIQGDTATNWWMVEAGTFHTCGRKTDNSIWCWGQNNIGQLGDGTTADRISPVQIGAGPSWDYISAGFFHTCAKRSTGDLYCWGWNSSGQLGDGTTANRKSPTLVGGSFIGVSTGNRHTCATKSANQLWCWGYNYYGQLGDGTTANRKSPTQVAGTSWDPNKLTAGSYHTCAIQTDGKLFCWGWNAYGQLGDGTQNNRKNPTQVGTATNWSKVSAGGSHACALKTTGTLWCWGYNWWGQLGDGTQTTRYSPVQIGTATDWVQVMTGTFYSTCALKNDSTLWCWGYNESGQHGDNTSWRESPVRVLRP